MRVTFVDSSFLLALVHKDDPLHERAHAWQRVLRGQFLTTEYVLIQTADALTEESLRRLALEMIWLLRADPAAEVAPVSTIHLEEGLRLLQEPEAADWSLTDCISFAIMRRAGIRDALTTNRHFEQAGFRSLLRMTPPDEADHISGELRAALCEAIRHRQVVQFRYHEGLRVVEPYRYGRSVMGHELLRGFQRRGHSQSGESAGWKTFRVSEIHELAVAHEPFGAPRAGYSGGESSMSEIYCQV
jgi:predicted nucleic acid-binding protein